MIGGKQTAILAVLVLLLTPILALPTGTPLSSSSSSNSSKESSSPTDTTTSGNEDGGSGEREQPLLGHELSTEMKPAESIPETEPTKPTEPVPETCFKVVFIPIIYPKHVQGENGEIIITNVSMNIPSRTCCEGYVSDDCELDLCVNLTCVEDPNSKCVTTRKCVNGERFPVFVTQQGIIADKCTQPEAAQRNLCADEVCQTESTCSNGRAVCFASRCDCSEGPVWLRPNGREADCDYDYSLLHY